MEVGSDRRFCRSTATTKRRPPIEDLRVAAISRWKRPSQQRRQGEHEVIARHVERARALRLASQRRVVRLAVDDAADGHMARGRQIHQVQAVERVEPHVGDQPVGARGKETRPRRRKIHTITDPRKAADRLVHSRAQEWVGFNEKDV